MIRGGKGEGLWPVKECRAVDAMTWRPGSRSHGVDIRAGRIPAVAGRLRGLTC